MRAAFGRLFGAAALVAFVLVTASCRPSVGAPGSPIRIGYFANLTHAQAVLGVASGDFARAVAPSPIEAKVFNAGPSLIEALFAGEIDIGYVGPGPTLSAYGRSRGEGVRVIAGAAADGVVVVARKGAGIASLANLAGKKLATPQLGNTQDISARHYLAKVLGAPLDDIVPIDNAQQLSMFATGEVDAAWVPEPWGERLVREAGAEIIAEEKELWAGGTFALTLVVTTPEFLKKRPDAVEAVLTAHRAWTRRLTEAPAAHVAELGDALFALTGKRLGADLLRGALRRVRFIDEPESATLQTFADWAHDLGFERRRLDVAPLVDTTLLHRLSAR